MASSAERFGQRLGHQRICNCCRVLPKSAIAREAVRGKQSGRTQEIQRLIGRSLRAVTDLEALGVRTVWVDCDVIGAMAELAGASTARAFVALALAFERLVAAGIMKNSPLISTVAATSVGIVDDRVLLDLSYEEDSRAEVDMNVIMTGAGDFVAQATQAEGRPSSGSEMQDLPALAAVIRRSTDEYARLCWQNSAPADKSVIGDPGAKSIKTESKCLAVSGIFESREAGRIP